MAAKGAARSKGKASNVPDSEKADFFEWVHGSGGFMYNKRDNRYKLKRDDKIALLEEYGEMRNPPLKGADLFECWYSSRSSYTEKRKAQIKKSGAAGGKQPKWKYYTLLSFLDDHLEPTQRTVSVEQNGTDSAAELSLNKNADDDDLDVELPADHLRSPATPEALKQLVADAFVMEHDECNLDYTGDDRYSKLKDADESTGILAVTEDGSNLLITIEDDSNQKKSPTKSALADKTKEFANKKNLKRIHFDHSDHDDLGEEDEMNNRERKKHRRQQSMNKEFAGLVSAISSSLGASNCQQQQQQTPVPLDSTTNPNKLFCLELETHLNRIYDPTACNELNENYFALENLKSQLKLSVMKEMAELKNKDA